jgi:HlyD family secretion protein
MSRNHLPWYGFAVLFVLPLGADEPKAKKAVLETSGYVVPIRVVTVSAQVAGQVIQLNADEGTVVKKGEMIAQLEASPYKVGVQVAVARLEGARARLEKARAGGTKLDGVIAQADVAVAEAEVEKAQWRLAATAIQAPLTGTVLARKAEVGNVVDPRATALSPVLCEIADLRELEVSVFVPERDVARITKGQACQVALDAFPKALYKAQVSRIMPVADRARGTLDVRVKIEVPERDTQLRPEMRAIVRFLGE